MDDRLRLVLVSLVVGRWFKYIFVKIHLMLFVLMLMIISRSNKFHKKIYITDKTIIHHRIDEDSTEHS
jgi:hypothetical protein